MYSFDKLSYGQRNLHALLIMAATSGDNSGDDEEDSEDVKNEFDDEKQNLFKKSLHALIFLQLCSCSPFHR